MANELSFARPLVELRTRIEELKKFTSEEGIDFSEEVRRLEQKAAALEKSIFESLTPMQKLQLARHTGRPTALEYIQGMCDMFLELHGDRVYGDDPAVVGGIAMLGGRPVTIIGQQKGRDTKENLYRNFGMPHPEGYRKALRLMEQAERFGRPVVCLIDTPGAYPGRAAEERGQGAAIATNLVAMAGLRVPIVCVVTGEGGSGGALGLGVGDRIYMLEHAIYSVISPDGAAAILWKDSSLAPKAAESMKITAQDLFQFGVIDGIIPEPLGGAHRDKEAVIRTVKETIESALAELLALPVDELLERRYQKYKSMGRYIEKSLEIDSVGQS